MITIELTSPDGNVFCILGYVRRVRNQLKELGLNTILYDELLDNYYNMTYDGIISGVKEIAGDFIRFTRNGKEI